MAGTQFCRTHVPFRKTPDETVITHVVWLKPRSTRVTCSYNLKSSSAEVYEDLLGTGLSGGYGTHVPGCDNSILG